MRTFKDFVEAQHLGMNQGPSVFGTALKAGGRALLSAAPIAGSLVDLVWGGVEVYRAWKEGKNVKKMIMQMMSIDDSARQAGKKNVFDLDDELANALSDSAKAAVADMIMADLKTIQFDPNQMQENLANIMAVKYLSDLKAKFSMYEQQPTQNQGQQPQQPQTV
jgi:hypothetical protein